MFDLSKLQDKAPATEYIGARVTPELKARLKLFCKQHGIKKVSALIIELVEQVLARPVDQDEGRTIWELGHLRIVELVDPDWSINELVGDYYADDPEGLRQFERQANSEGVYGYELQRLTHRGWEHVDSCWGFVGRYSETNDHYIVEDLKTRIDLMLLQK